MALEDIIRLEFFGGILILMILLELLSPRRADSDRSKRWPANFGILIIYSAILIVLPFSPIDAALQSIFWKFGVFYWYPLPLWWAIGISLLVLDFVIYWQHRFFHQYRMLWRLHRLHHSDHAYDVTTGFRFHPIEIILSVLLKMAVIVLLGAPLLSVLIFEIVLNGCAMFNHSNLKLPRALDKVLRWVLVTPDMHRVHHSHIPDEHNSNYGFSISLWDRLFGTYKAQPAKGHEEMDIGLPGFDGSKESKIGNMLTQPFRNFS